MQEPIGKVTLKENNMAGLLDSSALAGSTGPTRNRPQGLDNLLGFLSDPQSYKDMGNNLLDLAPNVSVTHNPNIPIQQGLGQERAANEVQLVKDAGKNAVEFMKSPIQTTTDTMAGVVGLAQEQEAIVAGDPGAIARAKSADTPSPVANKAKSVTETDTPKDVHNKQTYNQGLHDIVQAGGSEEDLSAWDRLNEEFDMTTVGMALLASNDGSSNMAANIGKAMMAGRASVANKADAAYVKEQEAVEASRKERETRVKEFNAMTARNVAVTGADLPDMIPKKVEAEHISPFIEGQLDKIGLNNSMSDTDKNEFTSRVMIATQKNKDPNMTLDQILNDIWRTSTVETDDWGGNTVTIR